MEYGTARKPHRKKKAKHDDSPPMDPGEPAIRVRSEPTHRLQLEVHTKLPITWLPENHLGGIINVGPLCIGFVEQIINPSRHQNARLHLVRRVAIDQRIL